ncbi:MAG: hypothetical protein ABJH45_13775 [Paracoccaceae bacterium]
MDFDLSTAPRSAAAQTERPVFVLVESNPIIAKDMVGILELSCECRVVHVSDADALLDAAPQMPKITAAFLEIGVTEFLGSEVENLLNHHGAEIILTKGESLQSEAQERGWHMLIRPFTEQMLRDLLNEMRISLQ